MLKDWATKEITDKGFEWDVNGVPVRVKFVTRDYDYFRFADIKVYGPEQYKIPNQWDRYWAEREKII